ncbi:beta-galactosidase [Oscillatoriales cyanobacterium USR001]|nr:beta-galactosidase [Oscillatoriales cyanobacterium USR001]
MNKKLAKIIGLFCLGAIVFGFVGRSLKNWDFSQIAFVQINLPHLSSAQANPLSQNPNQIYLNGIWQFAPAIGNTNVPPTTVNWGAIAVPGDWQREKHNSIPGLITRGSGKEWENFNSKTLSKAWYQRTIEIPQNWNGSKIILDLARVSTDAIIFLNNIKCGEISWPYGTVDITKFVKPGKNKLSILVLAVSNETEKAVIMGPTEIYREKTNLQSRGLIGEIRIFSIAPGPFISDIFVQPSTRKKQIKLDIELSDVKVSGKVQLIASMLDEKGEIEREFTTSVNIQAKPTQTIQVVWDWQNPRLWDIGKPNLYTLQLQIKGSGIETKYNQPFGFREFWIEGRKFYLNGTEIRLRPTIQAEYWEASNPQVADRIIDGYISTGFNIAEMWPWNHDERGRWHFRELLAERADLKGFGLMAPALDATPLTWSGKWNKGNNQAVWEQRMLIELRRYRNHPSVLLWAASPNFFGHKDDQNPLRIGKKELKGTISEKEDKRLRDILPMAKEIVAKIKKYDPTRPVMIHQGGSVGDVYGLNNYLNLIPLQEREEWLSEWSKNGDMPYMAVEFGTPLHTTMMRGRSGFGKAIKSEPLMTEFTAIYLGKQAYELETKEYRRQIQEKFVKDQEYKSWHLDPVLDFAPAFQKLQQLFSTNTWRSWRTFGISGGMIPWNEGHGWETSQAGKEKVNLPNFKDGDRGVPINQVSKKLWYYLQPEANIIHPGGQAIIKNNSSTLAWIAGAKSAFTEKDHSFTAGEKLEKQIVVINDTRTKQDFSFNWQVLVGGKQISSGQKNGSIETAGTLFFPLEAMLPTSVKNKVDGEIRLSAKIGNNTHEDRFNFRVFPILPKATGIVTVFDPMGKTTKMLQQLGYTVTPWDGSTTKSLLIIGKEVLSNGQKLPADLEAFVRNGGRAIIFSQQQEWLEKLGFRVAKHLTRRVFPVDSNHPVVSGLDEIDLRDWRGESTLVEAYTDITKKAPNSDDWGSRLYGWHWGNRGVVSSVSVEKPHRSGWRPILESEFDLAYSPLMELDYGKGRLILNTLDLEDHFLLDAAAAKLAQQILSYAQNAPLSPKVDRVVLIGSNEDAAKLDKLGVIYQKSDVLSADVGLVIVGADANINEDNLRGYLNGGGKVFFLPQRSNLGFLGVGLDVVDDFGGSLKVPNWPEVRGLSASDLRSRSFYDTWLIKFGVEVGADGFLGRVQVGLGMAIFSQINPDSLNADNNTYLRFTRWRQTRANAQILANLGASFKADGNIFKSGETKDFYHPDYRTDFELGDNPYRYYRW